MIVILDYGMGNAGSIKNMLRKIGADAVISSSPDDLKKAKKIVIPGVGAFDHGMNHLESLGILPLLHERVLEDKIPMLGICLGMQLFTKKSEEGKMAGLGWFDAKTVRFCFNDSNNSLKIPHMGWNLLNIKQSSSLFKNFDLESCFYFVHSYHVTCSNDEDVMGTTIYGYPFASIIRRENIIGVQFHPEKSHRFGMKLLKNFAEFF